MVPPGMSSLPSSHTAFLSVLARPVLSFLIDLAYRIGTVWVRGVRGFCLCPVQGWAPNHASEGLLSK